jgi:hypothetical protein
MLIPFVVGGLKLMSFVSLSPLAADTLRRVDSALALLIRSIFFSSPKRSRVR